MQGAYYRFVTVWRVAGMCGEVADVLRDPAALGRWWPAVYLRVDEIEPAAAPDGVGRRVRLLTKGWLPYTLRWDLVVTRAAYPHGFSIAASGDFEGTGDWTLRQDGAFVDVVYDWRVRARKPLLRRLSFLLRPLFAANHRWAMAQGEASLVLELARRRAASPADRRAIPAPPGPTTLAGVTLLAGILVGLGGLAYLLSRTASRTRGRRSG